MTNVHDPVQIVDYYPKWPKTADEDQAQPITPTFANVTISNVTSTRSPAAGIIWALPEMPIAGITFINVDIAAAKGMKLVHAHDIHFSHSAITLKSGPKFISCDAQTSGLN